MSDQDFIGAKLALFIGVELVVILRDDKPDIPFPAHWDFPGGGREDGESPAACVLRETGEEIGLHLSEDDLSYARCHQTTSQAAWFFAAHLPASRAQDIELGDEGQCWQLMSPAAYCEHPKGVPNFQSRLKDYLDQR
ncbi:nucleoside triphosphate pyrophosphohydrolase [Tritonibacter multivorans]|uniref:Nucleoside triphosphate pyrophosphohydrolase n=1 Tax=Tritonibacter multivorans TaxID=928856 RepID=A0A0P1GUV0_9RHOB|nr:NUDIX hydrolase [Tritonibacter multivorans]MDA7419825.1 NUDIX hydrolase [Tritonibacter multivorans]CUH79186.1 nucleoside triphosphate pyrophosphohydrolase [Tritonibacter multivorans]SFC15998.1 8-oxo-dGTP diphosphatase [Tritonibacter multivorans]